MLSSGPLRRQSATSFYAEGSTFEFLDYGTSNHRPTHDPEEEKRALSVRCTMAEFFFRPVLLMVIGVGLAISPLLTNSQWEWNGIPVNIMGYLFAIGGLIWTLATLRNYRLSESEQ